MTTPHHRTEYGLLHRENDRLRLACSCGQWERSKPETETNREALYRLHAQHMEWSH